MFDLIKINSIIKNYNLSENQLNVIKQIGLWQENNEKCYQLYLHYGLTIGVPSTDQKVLQKKFNGNLQNFQRAIELVKILLLPRYGFKDRFFCLLPDRILPNTDINLDVCVKEGKKNDFFNVYNKWLISPCSETVFKEDFIKNLLDWCFLIIFVG